MTRGGGGGGGGGGVTVSSFVYVLGRENAIAVKSKRKKLSL